MVDGHFGDGAVRGTPLGEGQGWLAIPFEKVSDRWFQKISMGGLSRILRRQPVGSRLVLVPGAEEIVDVVRSLDDGVYRILVSLKDAENQKSQCSALKLLGKPFYG